MQREIDVRHIGLIVAVGILVYLKSVCAGFLNIDDVGLIDGLLSSDFSVHRLLFSGAGEYFRPIPFISFAFDAFLVGAYPAWFHAVNVCIHLLNGLLVYLLIIRLFAREEARSTLALTGALIFTLHPLNTEAVMWISARADLLCTFFSLLSLILTLQMSERRSFFSACCLFATFLFSLLSKEVSIILLGVIPAYLFSEQGIKGWKRIMWVSAPLCVAAAVWFFLRSGNKVALDPGISKVVTGVVSSSSSVPGSRLYELLLVYGFYLQKIAMPFPQNFGIIHFNKQIALVAFLCTFPPALLLFWKKPQVRLPLLIILCGIVPAVAGYLAKVPWTPVAERYLYLPMVGFSILAAIVLNKVLRRFHYLSLMLVLALSVPTMSRVALWTQPVAFWHDVTLKSPRFSRAYIALAAAYIDARNYDAAEVYLNKARDMGSSQTYVLKNLGTVYLAKKQYAKYEDTMMALAAISNDPVAVYLDIIDNLLKIPPAEIDRTIVCLKVIDLQKKILEKQPSFFLAYYNIGKLYWLTGRDEKAVNYLEMFQSKAKGDPMLPFARKIVSKIKSSGGP